MSLSSNQIIQYLALLADPDQNRITREAWTVASSPDELVWAGWQSDSVVSVKNEPPAHWYEPHPASPSPVVHRRQPVGRLDENALAAYDLLKKFGVLSASSDPRESTPINSPLEKQQPREPVTPPRGVEGDGLKDLAALDELHREELLGRVGWLFLAGSIRLGSDVIPCCFPLFERRVRFARVNGIFFPQWQGSLTRNSLLRRRIDDDIEDPVDAFLKAGAGSDQFTTIGAVVAELLGHFGITLDAIAESTQNPVTVTTDQGLVLVPGTGFYLARPQTELTSISNDLSRWTSRHLSDTSLADLYGATDAQLHPDARRTGSIRSALPLNGRQRAAISRLNHEAVVAVSGPPGTGKTHMIVAAASDAVARGLSVLIATKSDFAAESTCELLNVYPTPPHVRFGQEAHRRKVADLLSAGRDAGITDEQMAALLKAEDQAWDRLETLGESALRALELKQSFEDGRIIRRRTSAPAVMLAPDFDLRRLDDLVGQVQTLQGLRHRRAVNRLRKFIAYPPAASVDDMMTAIAAGHAELAVRKGLELARGSGLDELWAELDRAETDAKASQAIVDIARRSRPSKASMASIASLATALRSSLGDSEIKLPVSANTAFLHHLPFWVGTLNEIESTLPANPGMFDLVIFDEASQIDQLSAVPALCRARQALIVGDPKQLRHTSNLTRQQIGAARTHAKIRPGDDAAILDIAANSLFDVAASATPVTWLDEHFRSAPHLIQFASERWYNNELRLMTQHPRNENLDVIHTHRVHSQRDSQVNSGEIDAIIDRLRALEATNQVGRSIGVITPFQAQAEALEAAIVNTFDYDTIQKLKLRVGTVRGVQGTERDTVLLSLVIDERDFENALALVEDPHVFNVMTTRARSRLDMFHSFDPATLPQGVLADWFRYESRPPGLSDELVPPTSEWTTALANALTLANVRVVAGYPVAGWHVDLVVGEGAAAFGVETTVHPDGPAAHAERHLTLRRAGWHLVSMFENSWLLQVEEAAVHVASIAARRAAENVPPPKASDDT